MTPEERVAEALGKINDVMVPYVRGQLSSAFTVALVADILTAFYQAAKDEGRRAVEAETISLVRKNKDTDQPLWDWINDCAARHDKAARAESTEAKEG